MKKTMLEVFVMMLFFISFDLNAQQKKEIQLEDIWAGGTFFPEMANGVNPLNDAELYLVNNDTALNIFSYRKGKFVRTLVHQSALVRGENDKPISFNNYKLSHDEKKILLLTETESIYRHSTKSNYYVYDLEKETLEPLSEKGKQSLADFSPDGSMVAFVRDNNIFVKDLANQHEIQITTDGKFNEVINGMADWVYEEEFSFTKAFFWSPDSKKIAFYRFDESAVKEFQLEYYQGLYPEWYKYKYPKAGESNSIIEIKIYDLVSNSALNVPLGEETDIYIPRIKWTSTSNWLCVQKMNRLQNQSALFLVNTTSSEIKPLYNETNAYYIDITDNIFFLPDNLHFVITTEKSGFNHIYLYNMSGTEIRQLTNGNWDVTEVYGIDERNKMIYYQSAETSPIDRHIYSVDFDGKSKKLTCLAGYNSADFSSKFDYFINTNTTANTPHVIQVYQKDGKLIRTIIDNNNFKAKIAEFRLSKLEFFTITDPSITLPDGKQVGLNAWRILPDNFDPTKKYPVLIYVYGGPGSQTVTNSWGWSNYFWFQMLAQKGMIVISVDNRGTGARGELFKKMTYKELGKYETEDLIASARYLSKLDYVDSSRIGVFGWSYGGYMSTLAITKGADEFSAAIAVAPVTSWRYYDNIYTERFMQKPQDNASGYDDNSPINHVNKLKGKYLLVHGSADDNVHYQNTMELINALVKANKQFDLMIYPNRNHGIYGGMTRLHLYTLMTDFLEQNLIYK